MTQLQQVLWTRGVLLAPQHLQAHDRFIENLLHFTLSTLTPFRWGFTHLEITEESLAAGELSVRAATGTFSDGLVFDFPTADVAPPPKPLIEGWNPDQSMRDVHLAIPKFREDGRNVTIGDAAAGTRFVSDVISRRDEITGQEDKRIEVARKNLRLVTGDESLDGYSTLPIARVTRTRSGALELDPTFVPPMLDFTASAHVVGLARGLLEHLAAKSGELSALRRQRNQTLAEFGNAGPSAFWLLYTVNSHLPRLRHLVESRGGHPSELFDAILALAGALTTFSTDVAPERLASYDHANPGPAFTSLIRDARLLLDRVLPARSRSIPLHNMDGELLGLRVAPLADDRVLASPEVYLAVDVDLRGFDPMGRAQMLKVSSRDDVRVLVQQSRAGAPLLYVPNPPSTVAVKPRHHYFRLATSGKWWDLIRDSRSIGVHAPKGFENASFELVAVLPDQ